MMRFVVLSILLTVLTAPAALAANAQDSAACNGGKAASADCLPHRAGSWGGIVRSGPGQRYARVATLDEGAKVMLLKKSEAQWNGFPWFRIRFGKHRQGFMWGGILCGIGGPFPGLYQTCPEGKGAKP